MQNQKQYNRITKTIKQHKDYFISLTKLVEDINVKSKQFWKDKKYNNYFAVKSKKWTSERFSILIYDKCYLEVMLQKGFLYAIF